LLNNIRLSDTDIKNKNGAIKHDCAVFKFKVRSAYVKLYIKDVLESNRLCKDTSCKCEKYAIYRKTSLHNIL